MMRPCEKISFCASVLFGILSVWYVNTTQQPLESCAGSCSCTAEEKDWGSAVNVQCDNRNLTSVPITIHDKPVSVLNVSFNVLMILKEDALFSYEPVRNLYLQHCKIVNINEKAFQRLENLTEIDLSNNRLTSVSPNLFNGNQKLDKLILRNNNLGSLQWNTPILNGPSSLSFLDLRSCKLSNISSITFSLLCNLTFLDISRNNLVLLNNDSLSSHENLMNVNLENNLWQCGAVFQGLMCWMHSKLAHCHNRTVQCQYGSGTFEIWSPENRSAWCDSDSTQSVTSSHKPVISASTNLNLASTPLQELDFSMSTKLNLANNPSKDLDISTSTKLNLASTPSQELDFSMSTKLNLASTPSQELDSSTSTKLNLASTPSHELDISTNKILNFKLAHKAEAGTESALAFFGMILLVLPLLTIAFVWLFLYYKECSKNYCGYMPLQSLSEEAS